MSYSLSFSDSFYCEGDPDCLMPSDRPTCVYQAILSIQDDQCNQIAREVFGIDPQHLDPMAVLDRVRQTNTCSDLESPVQVWIDPQGSFDVLVYDHRNVG